MNKNLDIIAKELFDKIRTQFPKIKLGDKDSKITNEPEIARFFDFEYTEQGETLGNINVSLSEKDGVVVIYSNDLIGDKQSLAKTRFFNFLKELREFAKQKLMNFDTRNITKSNLEKRDYEFLSNNIGEGKMTESKLYGTSMTSYQQLGDTRIVVKHSAPVNIDLPAGRTQRINSIYIENSQGERFRYPFKHLNGARALAQHIGHGGTPYDSLGQHVISLSEEMSKLRMFKHYVDRNPTISENIGSIKDKVAERIDEIKKQIFDLQSSNKYESFAESFENKEAVQIPEEIVNDWIDRLTIRTFNEELKNVFPYIFRLVDESDIPVKELSIDELLYSEQVDEEFSENYKDIPELLKYESEINKLVGETTDIFSNNEQAQASAIEKLNQLVANPLPVGADGTNAIESLTDIINDDELMDIFKELADVSTEADVRDILKDYIKMKDEEQGTDVFSKISFGEDEGGLNSAPAVPTAPAAPASPTAAPTLEDANLDVEKFLQKVAQDGNYDMLYNAQMGKYGSEIEKVVQDMYDNVSINSRLHPDDDFEEIYDQMLDQIENDYSSTDLNSTVPEGNAFAQAVAKAKAAGMKPGDKFNVGGKEYALKDAIEMAGMQVEDFFGNKDMSSQNELIEFVKSMYDNTTGNFPKGETGVLIAVEKKFGEGAVPVAQQVIGKLQNMYESHRVLKLAGLK
jgi:hypothetical protein